MAGNLSLMDELLEKERKELERKWEYIEALIGERDRVLRQEVERLRLLVRICADMLPRDVAEQVLKDLENSYVAS